MHTYMDQLVTSNVIIDDSTVHLYCVAVVTYSKHVQEGTSMVLHSFDKNETFFHLYSTLPCLGEITKRGVAAFS